MSFSDTLSIILLVDKIRGNKEDSYLRKLSIEYVEKLNLQIPESLRKLLSDVIRVLLEKSGIDRLEAENFAGFIGKTDGEETSKMFEAVIESIIEGREEARGEGLGQGLKQGKEQGLEQGLEIAARNALAEGATIEFVQKITGLDLETIRNLAAGQSSATNNIY